MIMTEENSSTLREKSPTATLSTADLTRSALRSTLKLIKEKPATYRHELYLVHGGHRLPTHVNKAGESGWQLGDGREKKLRNSESHSL
jgi:hypothetical protein